MKRFIIYLILLISILFISGCSNSILDNNIDDNHSINLEFSLDNVILSKSFQLIEPSARVLNNREDLVLSVSFGLYESSGVDVDKVTMEGNNIYIYAHRIIDRSNFTLAVPQATITIKDDFLNTMDKDLFKFHIINEDYDYVHLKYNREQIIQRATNELRIDHSSIPTTSIVKSQGQYIWELIFKGILNRDFENSTIANYTIHINDNTGAAILKGKDIISSYISPGIILDYYPNEILTNTPIEKDKSIYNSLRYINLDNGEEESLYLSKSNIVLGQFSPDKDNISIIEENNGVRNLYILDREDLSMNKITDTNLLNPTLISWIDDDRLCIVNEGEDVTNIVIYSMEDGSFKTLTNTIASISSIEFYDDLLIYITKEEGRLYVLSESGQSKFINFANIGKIIGKDILTYIYVDAETKMGNFNIYNIEEDKTTKIDDLNIVNILSSKDDKVYLVSKNPDSHLYSLLEFSMENKEYKFLAKIPITYINLDMEDQQAYISVNTSVEEDEFHIYSLDLKELR